MVRTWNKESKTSNENIKNCIGMCLTDANEQRFKDYGTNLKDCLVWIEKQKSIYPKYWKPSESQMKALEVVANGGYLREIDKDILRGLLEQLKAL